MPLEALCSENFYGDRFRLILQDVNDPNCCGFKLTVVNHPTKYVLKAIITTTDYTHLHGTLYLPISFNQFDTDTDSLLDNSINLRTALRIKSKLALYRRCADYLTEIKSIL